MRKLRILYIVETYPQISQTYIKSEVEAIGEEYEVDIISLQKPDLAYNNHRAYRRLADSIRISEAIDEFRPDVLHTHYLTLTSFVADLAKKKNIPFTVRTHSFDTCWATRFTSLRGRVRRHFPKAGLPPFVRRAVPLVNADLCFGILAFPFLRAYLERSGFQAEKIRDCFPVMNYKHFYDPSPNGRDVMNVGACLPKKQMEDFLNLAKRVPDRRFDLYAMGYFANNISRLNDSLGQPVKMIPAVEPDQMPGEYKKHGWLVYTASRKLGSVGWPVSIAEAQAAGLGVCMPNLRPDLKQYVGRAGFLYNSISEVADIISRPFPEELRQLGFEHARKSDISQHKRILLDLWQTTCTREPVSARI